MVLLTTDPVKFTDLLDMVPVAIAAVSADGVILKANRPCERLFGFGPAKMRGLAAQQLLAVDSADPWQKFASDAGRRPGGGRITAWHRCQDGTQFHGETTVSWVDQEAVGSGVAMLAVSRDLTELRQAQSRFEAVLESGPDAIIGLRRDGLILLMNAAAEQLLGYPRETLVGASFTRILSPESWEPIQEEVQRAFLTPDPSRPIEVDVLCADGTTIPTESVIARFSDGTEELIISSVRDLRGRRAAEEERRRLLDEVERRKAEQAVERVQRLEAVGQLAGGVAHDFNNLLAVIINYASLVTDQIYDLGPVLPALELIREDVARITRAAESGVALTRQLLAVGRRETADRRVLSINDIIGGLEHLLQTSVGTHVRLQLQLDEEPWAVCADRGQIEQILVNLAVNARDAMPTGGDIIIATSHLLAGDGVQPLEPGGRYVSLTVSDTGCGMPPEVIARVFEPFFTTKPQGRGTGLGLAMVYGIVTENHGTVTIDSQPGAGTRITVLLPVTDKQLQPEEQTPAPAPAHKRGHGTVLLVEDEPSIRDVAARVLTRQGYQVLAASDGQSAIDLARRHATQVEVLLTDVYMPGMLGSEVAVRVKQLVPDVRVIFMSGHTGPLLTEDGPLDSDVTLLEKPFTPTALLDILQRT